MNSTALSTLQGATLSGETVINEYLIVMEGSGSTGVESSVEKNLADLDLGSSPNPNNSQQHQVVKMAPRPGPMIGGMQEVRESYAGFISWAVWGTLLWRNSFGNCWNKTQKNFSHAFVLFCNILYVWETRT